MRIVMVGTGYVGLVSGACFAELGHDVTCVDKDADKIAALEKNIMPIFEPGLADVVAKNVEAGRLRFTTSLKETAENAEVIFIAVGTPSLRGDGYADLKYVYEAAREIAPLLSRSTVVVTKSTVPVGTGDEIEDILKNNAAHQEFAVVSNPEFLREGAALYDFMKPDRIVIGTEDEQARAIMKKLYERLPHHDELLMFTDRRTSELIKYAANAFLAMKVTFINEIADLCEEIDANVQEVSRGIGLDHRIGTKFLQAGPGIGGSCFPKDTRALMRIAQNAKAPLRLVETVVAANEARKNRMLDKIVRAFGDVKGKRVAVFGLTFKPDTDDLREAISLSIIPGLVALGADIIAYDPQGMEHAQAFFTDLKLAKDSYDCAANADGVVVLTEWKEFRELDLKRIKEKMRQPLVADLRNVFDPQEMRALGFVYNSIGRR
ncbi:MAG: UDP-glucose/GDP-mannose dehydrogenase family protein [Pseudomonadota bacterium]